MFPTAKEVTKEVQTSSTMVAVFMSNLLNSRYTFKSGKDLIFMNGEATTNIESEIKELMEEIDNGHPHIYIDPENMIKDTKFVDPVEAIRAQVIRDLAAQGKLTAEAQADFGASEQVLTLNVGNTKTVAEAMSGSNSSDGVAALSTSAPASKITIGPRA